jgi:hypothetical protein
LHESTGRLLIVVPVVDPIPEHRHGVRRLTEAVWRIGHDGVDAVVGQ